MDRLHEGAVLGGRYALTSRIASGGMGDVWCAQDQVLERAVAVKVMRPSVEAEEAFAERFRAEARHTAGLSSHPHIAAVYDYGEHDALAFLVMEYADGEPLSDRLRRAGRLAPEEVRRLMAQAALALGFAHEAGVVHRDVKPANVMIGRDGAVKLTDFGIARALDGSGHTRTGEVLGTPFYLSPEQALGRPATGASDLYALGVVAHEMLSGRRPFDRGTPVATALSHVSEPPPPLPGDVPEDLAGVVQACLAKDPADRPATGRAVAEALGLDPGGAALVRGVPAGEVSEGEGVDPRGGADTGEFPASDATMAWQPQWRGTPEQPLRSLEELLAHLSPLLHEGDYAVVSVPAEDPPPGLNPVMSIVEAEGLTLLVPVDEAREHGLVFETPMAWLTLEVYRALGALGYVPTLTTALGQAQIPAVAMAGRYHTHLLVPAADGPRALKVLRRLSRAHQE